MNVYKELLNDWTGSAIIFTTYIIQLPRKMTGSGSIAPSPSVNQSKIKLINKWEINWKTIEKNRAKRNT